MKDKNLICTAIALFAASVILAVASTQFFDQEFTFNALGYASVVLLGAGFCTFAWAIKEA